MAPSWVASQSRRLLGSGFSGILRHLLVLHHSRPKTIQNHHLFLFLEVSCQLWLKSHRSWVQVRLLARAKLACSACSCCCEMVLRGCSSTSRSNDLPSSAKPRRISSERESF